MTAAGIEAETVNPTRSPRYALAAPKTSPRTTPATIARRVNSSGGSPACSPFAEVCFLRPSPATPGIALSFVPGFGLLL